MTGRSLCVAPPRASLLLAALALGLAACRGEAGPSGASELAGRLVLTGSSTVAPLAVEIGRRFEGLHPGVRVEVQTGGSSRGIRDARAGTADIGMASRRLIAEERQGLRAYVIARDEIGLVVHANNPVETLTAEQVRGIYLGRIAHWREVVGRGPGARELGRGVGPITVIHKAAGRATRDVFVKHFELDERAIRPDVVIGDNEQGIKSVASDPGAIAYVSVGAAAYHAGTGVPIRRVRVVESDGESAAISRPLNLVTRTEVGELARAFIDYSRSPAVHDLVRDLYLVPASGIGSG